MVTPTAMVRVAFFFAPIPPFLPNLSCLFQDAMVRTLNLALTGFVSSGCLLPLSGFPDKPVCCLTLLLKTPWIV